MAREHWVAIGVVALLVMSMAAACLPNAVVWLDEVNCAEPARVFAATGRVAAENVGDIAHEEQVLAFYPPIYYIAKGFFFRIFRFSLYMNRLFNYIALLFCGLILYWILIHAKVALHLRLIVLILYITNPLVVFDITSSRNIVLGHIFIFAAFTQFQALRERYSPLRVFAAGALLGLAAMTYQLYALFMLAGLLALSVGMPRAICKRWLPLALCGFGMSVAAIASVIPIMGAWQIAIQQQLAALTAAPHMYANTNLVAWLGSGSLGAWVTLGIVAGSLAYSVFSIIKGCKDIETYFILFSNIIYIIFFALILSQGLLRLTPWVPIGVLTLAYASRAKLSLLNKAVLPVAGAVAVLSFVFLAGRIYRNVSAHAERSYGIVRNLVAMHVPPESRVLTVPEAYYALLDQGCAMHLTESFSLGFTGADPSIWDRDMVAFRPDYLVLRRGAIPTLFPEAVLVAETAVPRPDRFAGWGASGYSLAVWHVPQ